MTRVFYPQKPITNFRQLGTGRTKHKVVVVNEDGRIIFTARVRRNHPSIREVEFDNRKTFYMDSQNIDGQRVYLFLCTERLQDVWCKQSEVDAIEEWMKVASSKHIFAFLECVGLEREMLTEKYKGKIFKDIAKWQIRQHLEFLSLVELRRLTALLETEYPKPADSGSSAQAAL